MTLPEPPRRHGIAGVSLAVFVALMIVYWVWGSTYLAIRIALEGFPPLLFPGLRFVSAGLLLFAILRLRGVPAPSWLQWRNAVVIGFLLLDIGNGCVVWAEQSVGSALASTAVATVPLWAALFGGIWGQWPRRLQWLGLALGFVGIVALHLGGDFAAKPLPAALLMLSALSWAFGSVWSRRLAMPTGMMSAACQMLAAGLIFLVASAAAGEPWQVPTSPRAIAALGYLVVFGSVIAFSAYLYLLQTVSPALATSCSYVNPVIALLLGVTLGGEVIAPIEYLAIGVVIVGVMLIVRYNGSASSKPPPRR